MFGIKALRSQNDYLASRVISRDRELQKIQEELQEAQEDQRITQEALDAMLFCLTHQENSAENIPGLHRCPNALRHGILFYYFWKPPLDWGSYFVGSTRVPANTRFWRCMHTHLHAQLEQEQQYPVDFCICPYCGEKFVDLPKPDAEEGKE